MERERMPSSPPATSLPPFKMASAKWFNDFLCPDKKWVGALVKHGREDNAGFLCSLVHLANLPYINTRRFFDYDMDAALKTFERAGWMVVVRDSNQCSIHQTAVKHCTGIIKACGGGEFFLRAFSFFRVDIGKRCYGDVWAMPVQNILKMTASHISHTDDPKT